jgi:hypothetical protein
VIKDFLLPLGLDTNHSFAKVAVENSEVARRRSHLQQWAQSASKREAQESLRHDRLCKEQKRRADELYRELGLYQSTLELQGVADYVLRWEIKERKAVIDAALEQIRAKEWQASEQCNNEFRKQERSCKEQRATLRAWEDLEANERTMDELDHGKDQVMTVCKVALANLEMWVRDHSFPASSPHATWQRLAPFFRLSGTIMQDATTVHVELRPFNDRALNRDLALLGIRVNEASPRLPDGRQRSFPLRSTCHLLPSQEHQGTGQPDEMLATSQLEKRSVSPRLCNLLQVPVPGEQESFHVACEDQRLSQPPKDAQWSTERKQINHECPR